MSWRNIWIADAPNHADKEIISAVLEGAHDAGLYMHGTWKDMNDGEAYWQARQYAEEIQKRRSTDERIGVGLGYRFVVLLDAASVTVVFPIVKSVHWAKDGF